MCFVYPTVLNCIHMYAFEYCTLLQSRVIRTFFKCRVYAVDRVEIPSTYVHALHR
jgi:hypothetical protein